MRFHVLFVGLTAIAFGAASCTPYNKPLSCQGQCGQAYDSCQGSANPMGNGGSEQFTSFQFGGVKEQCRTEYKSCVKSCDSGFKPNAAD